MPCIHHPKPRPPPPPVYRPSLTFAERIGPNNAKSIILHYLAVLILSYAIWTARSMTIEVSEACGLHYEERPSDFGHWASVICNLSSSTNMAIVLARKYLDFSSYYIIIFVVVVNTLVMLLLSKHLWRAFWVEGVSKAEKEKKEEERKRRKSGSNKDNNNVVIDMGEQAMLSCSAVVDDNILIDIILALFDFFRVSETKQEG